MICVLFVTLTLMFADILISFRRGVYGVILLSSPKKKHVDDRSLQTFDNETFSEA